MSISATRRAAAGFDRRHWFGKLWPKWSWTVEKLNWNARYRAWLEEHGMWSVENTKVCFNREHMYQLLCPSTLPICYMEFGVYKGESLSIWANLNQHTGSRFHGFDSFEGLPEEEGAPFEAEDFKTRVPQFDDDRIMLHEGWFNQTLPAFSDSWTHPTVPLIINMDADLYGSALYVLTMIDHRITPGTIIMLDESSVAHCEFRALLDWSQAYGRKYKVIAGWSHGRRVEGVAIEVIG